MSEKNNSARQKFLNQYRIMNQPIPMPTMTKAERTEVVTEWSKSIERNKIKRRENQRKRSLRKAKVARRKLVGRIAVLGLAGITLFSGMNAASKAYEEYKEQNSPARVEQVLETGASYEELGIDSETVTRLETFENIIENEGLTYNELIMLAPQINELQFDVLESKFANIIGDSKDNIRLDAQYIGRGETRDVIETREKTYVSKDIFTSENTFSSEISDQITNIKEMQKFMQEIQEGNVNREQVLRKYEKFLENISQFAGMKLQIDGKENITAQKTRVAEFDKYDKAVHDAAIKNASIKQQDSMDER